MRDTEFSAAEAALRPKPGRLTPEPAYAAAGAAASAGRPSALGADGILDLQRTAGNSAVTGMLQRTEDDDAGVHGVVSSAGRPLEPTVRGDMESLLGQDFSDVRIHDDTRAHASAQAVNAHAYTSGTNVVFQRGKYDPGSSEGRVMLAHELTHVVQQRSGPVDGTPTADGISVSDPSDRFEREAAATAERVAGAGAPAPAVQRACHHSGSCGHVQRDAESAEEEEPVQGSFAAVQRTEGSEEEAEEQS